MPGCVIQCSNLYHDSEGDEVVSPVEYETLGLLGSNCGVIDPDDLAQLNAIANDLGIDTIEIGATLALLMEAGDGAFGDVAFMRTCLDEIAHGSEKGRAWAQGAARVGAHLGLSRVPVIKRQAISAYDPRVVEGTGVAMMATAQGADHTVGNLPRLVTSEMSVEELIEQSLAHQVRVAGGGEGAKLPLEAVDGGGIHATQRLQRDLAAPILVPRRVHHAHAPRPEAPPDGVAIAL